MSKETILIVEDEEAIRESITMFLEHHGYKTLGASDGIKALDILKIEKPDLILSDVMMPGMDGFDFLHEVQSNPDTELIPVIMLTARADLEAKLQGLEMGADDYITKPFEFKVLHLKIIYQLKQRQRLLRHMNTNLPKKIESKESAFLKKLDLLLHEQMENSKLMVGGIASHLNMSTSTFNRHLKKITGKSPNQYVKEFRLNKAREMIRHNYGNISEIARKNGFGSPSYFSTQYKEFFGHAPKTELNNQ